MEEEKDILVGINDSDFSRQALLGLASLLKNSEKIKVTLYHGASWSDLAMLSGLTEEGAGVSQEHWELWHEKVRKVLDRAKEALIASGFNSDNATTRYEKKCMDPADAMLTLANQEGFETLAVARWGKKTASRRVIGSVTYRLAQLADNRTLWVIDPRICSQDVLVCLVGASVSKRIVDYTVRYFAHLKDSRFTLIHVIPPVPPQWLNWENIMEMKENKGREKITKQLKDYTDSVKKYADYAKKELLQAGVPEKNIFFKLQPQKRGIARDILLEIEEGDHGILVMGRKGFKDIKEFGLGSKATKLLLSGRTFISCLVH